MGAGATVAAGTGAVLASTSTLAMGEFVSLRYSDRNTELMGPDERPLIVDETVLHTAVPASTRCALIKPHFT